MDQQLKQDFLDAAINDNRTFIEQQLAEDDATTKVLLNELLRKAAQYGSVSVVELLCSLGKIILVARVTGSLQWWIQDF